MKKQSDKLMIGLDFEVGDWVYLKLQPNRHLSVEEPKHQKLSTRNYGPFRFYKKKMTLLLTSYTFPLLQKYTM